MNCIQNCYECPYEEQCDKSLVAQDTLLNSLDEWQRGVNMTENEAIEKLKNMRLFMQIEDKKNDCKFTEDDYKANEMAIQALEEVQQYRAIGTSEELQATMEKQIAKKPTYEGDGYSDGQLVYDTWICPRCGRSYELDNDGCDYCPNCGQNLDWGDEE